MEQTAAFTSCSVSSSFYGIYAGLLLFFYSMMIWVIIFMPYSQSYGENSTTRSCSDEYTWGTLGVLSSTLSFLTMILYL
jgi:hypothetical protein